MTKSKVVICEHCQTGWIYRPDRAWYPKCWHCGQSWKAQRTVQAQDDWGYWNSWWPQPNKKNQRQAQRAAEYRATQKFLSQQDEQDLSQDWDMSPPGLMGPQDDKYKEAAAALWEGAEPAALSFSTESKSSSLRAADKAREAATSGSACEISTLISSSHKSAWLTPGCWDIPCKGAWVVNLATVGAYGQPAHRPFWGHNANVLTPSLWILRGPAVNLKT